MTKKRVIFVHGRDFKPDQAQLTEQWLTAIRHALKRDNPEKLDAFENTKPEMAYYANISNKYLRSIGREYDQHKDVLDREKTLKRMMEYESEDFKQETYENITGKNSMKEAMADAFGGIFSFVNIADKFIQSVAPDMAWYWKEDSEFGSEIRWSLTEILRDAFEKDEEVLLISHSLGTMIAYDVLWKFSHYGEYRYIRNKKLHTWITLGSPLGDETVKSKLKGANLDGKRKYPTNINRWINIAAEDDFISHDQAVENDYREMLNLGLIRYINDYLIYNLSVRHGRSNPHNGTGYLINPIVSNIIADWL